ncbi:hypothetical protein U9M48_027614 [Paspalum notatum var. saurae]|uniref:Uncharacterized protein n=1 Tax=Paspalum notatum var. saurae TaxID=547442 RepID=A0AAQ3X0N1_PASNO
MPPPLAALAGLRAVEDASFAGAQSRLPSVPSRRCRRLVAPLPGVIHPAPPVSTTLPLLSCGESSDFVENWELGAGAFSAKVEKTNDQIKVINEAWYFPVDSGLYAA